MSSSTTPRISESTLKTDLNDLAHSLVRELAMAAKKVSIYGKDHPSSERAVAKPFVFLSQIFHYRRFVNIDLLKGHLYMMNIRLKESVFTEQVLQMMQMQDITMLLIDATVTSEEFTTFVDRFVRRVSPADPNYRIADFLKRARISNIEVDSERSARLFENRKQYRGDLTGDFTVKRIIFDLLADDLKVLAENLSAGPDHLLNQGIDFYPPAVAYVIPEKIITMPADRVREQLITWAKELKEQKSHSDNSGADLFLTVMKLLANHPKRSEIVADLDEEMLRSMASHSGTSGLTGETGKIKIQSRQQIQVVLDDLFDDGPPAADTPSFLDAFERLLKTGQHDEAITTLDFLLDRLSDSKPDFRQRSLDVLTASVRVISPLTNAAVLEQAVGLTLQRLSAREETYEYSELLYALFEKCLADARFDLLARLTTGMASRKQVTGSVVVYDGMAMKKAFENINRPSRVNALVTELMRANHDQTEYLKKTMVAIGSEEIALALSEIIAHPIRQVRQVCLRILSEMGKATLRVFSRILIDDAWFERPADRHELPDAKWYVVRNSIFVLGLLQDTEALVSLRLRLNDKDARVRREIITTLEKIGGDDAVDLLGLMADDSERENAEAAVIAIGLIGTAEAIPLLKHIVRRNPSVAMRFIYALGKIGGEEARDLLVQLLHADNALTDLATGKFSKDELRVAIIKALGAIGDKVSIGALKDFQKNLSVAQKLLFKNSPVQKTISEVLARR